MAKRFEKPKMVPVPSHSIIPDRDVGKSPILECSHPRTVLLTIIIELIMTLAEYIFCHLTECIKSNIRCTV